MAYISLEDGEALSGAELARVLADCQRRLDRLEVVLGTFIDLYLATHGPDPDEPPDDEIVECVASLERASKEMHTEYDLRTNARIFMEELPE